MVEINTETGWIVFADEVFAESELQIREEAAMMMMDDARAMLARMTGDDTMPACADMAQALRMADADGEIPAASHPFVQHILECSGRDNPDRQSLAHAIEQMTPQHAHIVESVWTTLHDRETKVPYTECIECGTIGQGLLCSSQCAYAYYEG